MGCCASVENTEKPAVEMRQASKQRLSEDEDHNSKRKPNGAVVEDTPTTYSNQKSETVATVRIPKLDMSKVVNNKPVEQHKPNQQVHAKPAEQELKEDRDNALEVEQNLQAKSRIPLNSQPKVDSPEKRRQDPSPKNAISIMNKLKMETTAPANMSQTKVEGKKIEEIKAEPPQVFVSETNQNKPEVKESQTEEKKDPLRENKFVVGPDIFVSLKTGSIADYYKVGQVLGEGAYGKVSIVTHRTTGILRAMKSIKKKSVVKEEAEKLFAEVSILKELDHPNIVKLYELFQDNDCFYLITEYCNGGELFDRIQKMQNLSEKQASEYMKQILSAVVYCHSRNVVHRDLKPENLLLDSKKPDSALKVIDFGTSKKFEIGKKMTERFGTPYYIAPEVLSRKYDEKCDVWSCGVILYILLCGYPPFNGRNDNEIINRVKSGKFTFDDAEWGRVSTEAKSLIKKMLTFDPKQRISAREALDDPWMQKNTKSAPLSRQVLDNLSTFSSKNKLKQAILTFIVTQVTTQQEKDELQKTFQSLDKDKNGILTREELIEGYVKVFGAQSRAKAEEEATKIIQEVDVNGSGEIDFSEFIMAAMNKELLLSKQKIAQAFKLFDQNGDGFITRQELAAVMGGIELDDEEWRQIIDEVDTNKDGKISQDEFFGLLTKNNFLKSLSK